jgi:DNA polymerase III subunit chi
MAMTAIDFHFNTPNRLEYACRLTRKIFNAGQALLEAPLAVFCTDRARLDEFDDLLWSLWPEEFIPHSHVSLPEAYDSPILLMEEDTKLISHTLLLNLDNNPPPFFSRYVRLFEVVSTEDADRAKARERFAFYRDRGYAINNYDLSKKS